MRPTSLRWRLLLGGAVWIGIALVCLGLILTGLFRQHVTDGIADDLRSSLNRLVAQLEATPRELPEHPLADPRYELPYGGLYWQVQDRATGRIVRSPSLFDEVLVPDPNALGALSYISGPENTELVALTRLIYPSQPEGSNALLVTLAQDRNDIERAVSRFGQQMIAALALVWLVLLLAALLQVHLGLSPLRKMHAGLQAVRAGKVEALAVDIPRELVPLTSQINQLLAEQRASLEFARARASDLAHGLRTPLAALQSTADRLRALGDDAEADMVERLSESMTDRINYQLRLAQLRLRAASNPESAHLCQPIDQSAKVLAKTAKGEGLAWVIDCPPDIRVDLDRHDLMELIGVLLDNAVRHARTKVEITVRCAKGMALATIADDGPGMTEEQMSAAFQRGVRFDERADSSGLGLAIAFDIAAINHGKLELGRSRLGGLQAMLALPVSMVPCNNDCLICSASIQES